jgi:hypothetical protein
MVRACTRSGAVLGPSWSLFCRGGVGAPEPTVADVLLRDAPSSMLVLMDMGADILRVLCPHAPPALARLSGSGGETLRHPARS